MQRWKISWHIWRQQNFVLVGVAGFRGFPSWRFLQNMHMLYLPNMHSTTTVPPWYRGAKRLGWAILGGKVAFFSSLGRILSSVMSCPTLNASNPLGGPKTHPYPSKSFQNPFF